MGKKMSKNAKVLLIIAIVAIVGAGATLLFIFTPWDKTTSDNNNNQNNNAVNDSMIAAVNALPNQGALRSIFARLNGYWVSGSQFAGFSRDGAKLMFEYGLLQSGYGVSGEVIESKISGNNAFSLKISVPARAATEMDDGYPARKETVYVDVSNYTQDRKLNIKIKNLGDGSWMTYEFGGRTLEEVK